MAEDGKVIIGTELDDSGLESGMKKTESNFSKFGKGIGKVGGTIAKGAAVAVAAVGAAVIKLGKDAITYNANMEQYATSFEVMTGSAEKAADMMAQLKKMGAETPFEFEDLAKATQTLMAFGMQSQEAIDSFKVLGDIAQGDAGKLDSFTLSLGKMQSSGKVTLEYLNLMIENGFNPLQEISESTGESMESLYDRVSKGAVSVDEIKESMQRATSEGGKFFGSMDKQSKTLNGRISTLKDNFKQLTGAIFEGATTEAGSIIELAIGWVDTLKTAFEEGGIEGMMGALGNILADIVTRIAEFAPKLMEIATGIIMSLLNGLMANLPQIIKGATDMLTAFLEALIQMFPMLLSMGTQFVLELIMGISDALPELIPAALDMMIELVTGILDNMPMIIECAGKLIVGLIEGIFKALPKLIAAAPQIIVSVVKTWIQMLGQIFKVGYDIIVSLWDGIKSLASWIWNKVSGFGGDIWKGIKNGIGSLWSIGYDMVIGLWNGIVDVKNWILNKISGFCNDIWSGIKGFFGIHSPSKLLEDTVGKNLGLGIGIGLEDSTKDVLKDVDKFNKAVYDEFDKQVAWSGQTTWVNPGFVNKPSTQSALMEALAGQQVQPPVELNFYDTQTDPDAIYQKFYQQQTMGLAREF